MAMKVLYVPSYDYLSIPMLNTLARGMSETYNVFLNHNEYNNLIDERHLDCFDEVINCDIKACDFRFFIARRFHKLLFVNPYRKYKVRSIVKKLNPDVVISTTDCSITYKVIFNEINSLGVVHYIIQPSFFDVPYKPRLNTFRALCEKFYNKLIAPVFPSNQLWGAEFKESRLFLWGDKFVKYYENCENTVYSVGNINFDGVDLRAVSHNKTVFNFDVLICTEALDGVLKENEVGALYDFYNALADRFPLLRFAVKLHPRDDINIISNKMSARFSILTNYSLDECINISRIQVSVASSSSLIALLKNRPVLLINPDGKLKIIDVYGLYMPYRATTVDEAQFHIESLLTISDCKLEEWRSKVLNDYMSGGDKLAVEEIKRIVFNDIKNS